MLFSARLAWRSIFPKTRHGSVDSIVYLVGLVAACLLAVDVNEGLPANWHGIKRVVLSMGCMLTVTTMGILMVRFFSMDKGTKRFRYVTWLLLFISFGMSAWTLSRLRLRIDNYESFGASDMLPGELKDDHEHHGVTDQGRWVPLYRFAANAEKFASFSQTFGKRFANFSTALIHRRDADQTANCHGWVFTGGQHLLRGEGVAKILEDNGYQEVAIPVPGDIIIYRDAFGVILHTGLVQGVLKEGTVMIESKWGVDQRFLHLPTDQPYSANYQYYHTDRGSHQIEVRSDALDPFYEG